MTKQEWALTCLEEVTHSWVTEVTHTWVARVPHEWVSLVCYEWVLGCSTMGHWTYYINRAVQFLAIETPQARCTPMDRKKRGESNAYDWFSHPQMLPSRSVRYKPVQITHGQSPLMHCIHKTFALRMGSVSSDIRSSMICAMLRVRAGGINSEACDSSFYSFGCI